ncbi:MAG: N-6 DNA methylase [Candidatus Hodarchaeales archaeon]
MDRLSLEFGSILEILLPKVRSLLEECSIQDFLPASNWLGRFEDANALGTVLIALFFDKLLISYSLLSESTDFHILQTAIKKSKINKEQIVFISTVKKLWRQASRIQYNIPILKETFTLNKILDLILIESDFVKSLIEIIPLDYFSYQSHFLLLPTIVGDVVPPKFRQEAGQVFTPEEVVIFLARHLARSDVARVIDPCCGTGILLLGFLEAYSKDSCKDSSLDIIGVEIDPLLTMIAESSLRYFLITHSHLNVKLRIINRDFFKCSLNMFFESSPERKTAIIMNPPYTRHEKLNSKYKSEIRSIIDYDLACLGFKSISKEFLSKRIGFYIYFVIHATVLLHVRDSMAIIMPNAWMDVDYGVTIQKFLLSCFKIRYLVSSELNKFIPSVDVNTVILVLVRRDFKDDQSAHGEVKFITVKKRDYLKKIKIDSEALSYTLSDKIKVVDVDLRALTEDNKWGKFFRAPAEYFRMMRKIHDDFLSLDEISTIKRGFTTGANEFFYLGKPGNENRYFRSEWDKDTGDLYLYLKDELIKSDFSRQGYSIKRPMFRIEKDYWMHRVSKEKDIDDFKMKFIDFYGDIWIPNYLIKSSKHINRYMVKESDIDLVVLLISSNEELKPGIKEYIRWGESWRPNKGKMKFNLRPTCATRKPWFALNANKLGNCEFLCLMTINDRFIFFYNPFHFYFDARLYGISLKNDSIAFRKALYLYLNSIIVSFQLELLGRVNLGEGGLDIKVYEYASLKLPKPLLHLEIGDEISKTFSRLLRFQPISIITSEAVFLKELAVILIGDILGYTKDDIDKLLFHLKVLVKNRLQKARERSS